MKTQYIIQITGEQSYPFDGAKEGCSVLVRASQCLAPQTQISIKSKVNALISHKSPTIMQVIRIVQFKAKRFEIDFEYVSQSLKNSSKMNQASFVPIFRQFLTQHCKFLIDSGIKHQIRLQNIGLNPLGQLKNYLGLNFELVCPYQRQSLEEQYQIMVQKLIETHFHVKDAHKNGSQHTFISDYSHKITKKLSQLEDRLNKARKYSKNSSLSSSQSNGKNQQPSSTNILKDLFAPKKTSKNEVAAGLTSNSFILNKNGVRPKAHKLSFADYQTNSYRLDQSSSKQSSLTKRINSALQKTEFAFKVYQKYTRRKERKRS